MHPRQSLPPHLNGLTEAQSGALTRRQILEAGISPRALDRLSSGWVRLRPGLYSLNEPDWMTAAWAGLLHGGPTATLSGAAACYLDSVLRDEPSSIDVWATAKRSHLEIGPWRVQMHRGRRSGRGDLTRAPIEISLLDYSDGTDEDSAVAAIAAAFAQRRTSPRRLQNELSGRRTRHSSVIADFCGAAGRGIESALEWRFETRVRRPHGLPMPTRQRKLFAGRTDNFYEEFGLILELDGMRDHGNWSQDMFRDNSHLLAHGALTLRYGWHTITKRACDVAQQIASALRSRGWRGTVRRCKDCANAPFDW